jgi:hypothetical protein
LPSGRRIRMPAQNRWDACYSARDCQFPLRVEESRRSWCSVASRAAPVCPRPWRGWPTARATGWATECKRHQCPGRPAGPRSCRRPGGCRIRRPRPGPLLCCGMRWQPGGARCLLNPRHGPFDGDGRRPSTPRFTTVFTRISFRFTGHVPGSAGPTAHSSRQVPLGRDVVVAGSGA